MITTHGFPDECLYDRCLLCASIVTIVTLYLFQLLDGLKQVDDYEVTLAHYNWYVYSYIFLIKTSLVVMTMAILTCHGSLWLILSVPALVCG